MQVVQHELEGLCRERPGLTPRPTRDVAALKDLVNNEKVRHITACSYASQLVTNQLCVGVRCGRQKVTETPVVLCEGVDAGGWRLSGYLWSHLRYGCAQNDAVLAAQAYLNFLLQLRSVWKAMLYAVVIVEPLQGSQCQIVETSKKSQKGFLVQKCSLC